jgi:YidC/Oxa1 family membrane protein insertase
MTGFFEWILQGIYGFVGNYGWAVVIFTVFIRLVVLPLDIKSRKGMRAMTRVQPKMQELQKKYANDQEKLNRKMAELYKSEHVSPMSGCLPMIIQLVVMILMFNAMRNIMFDEIGVMMYGLFNELVEKGAESVAKIEPQSFLWIKNIFQPDSVGAAVLPSYQSALSYIKNAGLEFTAPEGLEAIYNTYINMHFGANEFMTLKIIFFNITVPTTLTALTTYANGLFILPLFACFSQILMTKLNSAQQPQPANGDPNQPANMMNGAMMKWFFPLFSLYICATQNAAFSVYWAVANIIAIVQQVCITKYFNHQDRIAAEKAAAESEQ